MSEGGDRPRQQDVIRAVLAGILYFAVVFALGFCLGTIRVLVVTPLLGEGGAVLLELPIMLAASWVACRWLVRRMRVPPAAAHRITTGAVAFALLMLAELGVSVFAFARTPAEHIATYRSWSAWLGLAAQMAFAAMPLASRASTFRDQP